MARKPETTEQQEAADVVAEVRALQELGEQEFQLDSVLASLGDSDEKARVMLYRVGKSGEKDKYLRKFTPQEWLDYGQDGVLYDYGGGSYRVRVYDARSKLRANTGLELEEPRTMSRAPVPPYPARLSESLPHAAPSSVGGADILAAVGAMAQAMQTAMTAAFDKLAGAIQQQPKREDMLREMLQLKQLFTPDAKPAPTPIITQPDSLETFMKAVTFVKENLSPNSGETGPADVFLEMAKHIVPVIAEQARIGAQITAAQAAPLVARVVPGRAVHAGPPLPETAVPAATEIPQSENTESDMNFQLKMAVGFLVQQAKNESDPETYADMVLDNVAPELIEEWRAKPADELLTWLASINPEVSNHAQWFREVHASIVAALVEETAADAAETGAAGDPLTNVANASKIGSTGETED